MPGSSFPQIFLQALIQMNGARKLIFIVGWDLAQDLSVMSLLPKQLDHGYGF